MQVCTDLAYRGTVMRPGDKYTEVNEWQLLPGRAVVDELARKKLEQLGTWVFWKAQLWAVFWTAIALALPPGYGMCGAVVC